jgi:hypothetical protein
MFEKVLLEKSFSIDLDFGVEIARPVFHRAASTNGFCYRARLQPETNGLKRPFSCIAYLLYAEVNDMETE